MASVQKKKKTNSAQKVSQADRAYTHILICFGVVAVIELGLLGLRRIMEHYESRVCGVMSVMQLAFAALTLLLLAAYFLRRSTRHSFAVGVGTLASALFSLTCSYVAALGRAGVGSACVMFIAAAAIFLVYETYRREMFVIALVDAAALTALVQLRRAEASGLGIAAAVIALALAAAAACGVMLAARRGGKISLFGRQFTVLNAGWRLLPVLSSLALGAVAVILALAFGETAAFYGIIAVSAALFVSAVYYTVKLM